MRALEFLVEYRRDKTAAALGDNLLKMFSKLGAYEATNQFDELYNEQTLVGMVFNPKRYHDKAIRVTLGDKQVPTEISPGPRAVEVLEQFKPYIISKILEGIESKDPTQNKEYTQWLARMWSKGNVKFEDLNRHDFLRVHQIGKRRKMIPADYTDINVFKDYSQFEYAMEHVDADKILGTTATTERGEFKELYNSAEVRVIQPMNTAAACYYGKGTKWCTAATRGDNLFDNYNKHGSIYILLPKVAQYTGEKYQLHFETGQFMNEKDDPIDLRKLLTERFPELLEFFKKIYPDIVTLIPMLEPDDIMKIWQAMVRVFYVAKDLFDDLDADAADVNNIISIRDFLWDVDYNEIITSAEAEGITRVNDWPEVIKEIIHNNFDRMNRTSYVVAKFRSWIDEHIVVSANPSNPSGSKLVGRVGNIKIGYRT
jgi:hypothetical protein